jgi:hypothetical protein
VQVDRLEHAAPRAQRGARSPSGAGTRPTISSAMARCTAPTPGRRPRRGRRASR